MPAGWNTPVRLPDPVNISSSGRLDGDTKDHLFIVRRAGEAWGKVEQIRYLGDDQKPDGFSTDDEPHLGPDHRTLYFSSDRVIPVHFPRTHEQAQKDFERMESWDNSNTNVWFIPLASSNPENVGSHLFVLLHRASAARKA